MRTMPMKYPTRNVTTYARKETDPTRTAEASINSTNTHACNQLHNRIPILNCNFEATRSPVSFSVAWNIFQLWNYWGDSIAFGTSALYSILTVSAQYSENLPRGTLDMDYCLSTDCQLLLALLPATTRSTSAIS